MLKLANKKIEIPIIQGGMGVGVSLSNLAGSVAANGAIGVVSSADIGFREIDYLKNPVEANINALKKEVKMAKELSKGKGLIGVNVMACSTQYEKDVRAAVEAGADLIISGAGIPKSMPEYIEEGRALMAPIVSSAKAANLICKTWLKKYNRLPDLIIVEGPKAGGHLGFKEKDIIDGNVPDLEEIVKEVLGVAKIYEEESGKNIPIFAAGGIWDKEDINKFLSLGASGVQMATRFIGTYECDASKEFKEVLLAADSKDLTIIHSPVGMAGRAIKTPFVEKMEYNKNIIPSHCYQCISYCKPAEVPYCITEALVLAVKGEKDKGVFFAGANLGRLDRLLHVNELLEILWNK